ncbi:MAG TPA: alpha/beta fold hydrolase, partial [Armatimonadetes bacterium]|nr:alpha/beta fold hydrolase [Armatimonadota bacterium]
MRSPFTWGGNRILSGLMKSGFRIRWRWVLIRLIAMLFMLWLLGSVGVIYLSFHRAPLPLTRMPSDLGLPYEDVIFTTEDGVRIAGWFIPARGNDNHCTIIICHGYPGVRSRFIDVAPALHRAGYSVFMFDFRGNGHSGGRPTIGRTEVRDLRAAVHWLKAHRTKQAQRIGVIGFSMG